MTNNLDLFLNIQPYRKRVRYANNTSSLALGIGTVAIQGKLPNGNTSSILLQRVLYVPDLGSDNLFSWNAVCGMGSDIFIRKEINGKNILWARKDHSDFVIQEQQDVARLASFEEWHPALGHVSPAYMSADCYIDGHLIPTAPKHFECHHCSLSKSTKKVPP